MLRMATNARKNMAQFSLIYPFTYATVGKNLMLELINILKFKDTLCLIESLLFNRKYNVVFLNGEGSRYEYLQNGLSNCFILFPILFNVYTSNTINTVSKKCLYADDTTLVVQAKSLTLVKNRYAKC